MTCRSLLAPSILLLAVTCLAAGPAGPLTVPERTNYTATSRLEDVRAFFTALAAANPDRVVVTTLGRSAEGRSIPLVILGDPAPAAPQDARRPAILLVGNIHAGEVEGKEALQMLARDLLAKDRQDILKRFTLLLVPVFNADGNEAISPGNRPYQRVREGVGERPNGMNLDLNRDFVKLETPEVRALVRAFDLWNPFVAADLHTTNGSYHEEPLTWVWGKHPAGSAAIASAMHDEVFPWMKAYVEAHHAMDTLPYGDFDDDVAPKAWKSLGHAIRVGVNYFGVRGAWSFLDENYAYADFPTRVRACSAFLDALLAYVSTHAEAMEAAVESFRQTCEPRLYTDFTSGPYPEKISVKALRVTRDASGQVHPTDEPMPVTVDYVGKEEAAPGPVLSGAYCFPPGLTAVRDVLLRHGIRVFRIGAPFRAKVHRFDAASLTYGEAPSQGHVPLVSLEGTWGTAEMDLGGFYAVPLTRVQKALALVPLLLEPESEEGLIRFGFFDAALYPNQWSKKPGPYPVVRAESLEGAELELVSE